MSREVVMGACKTKLMADEISIDPHRLAGDPNQCYKSMIEEGRFNNVRPWTSDGSDTEKRPNTVRFVCISDTHNQTDELERSLPAGDILIHSGDFTQVSTQDEIVHFNNFLGRVKNKFRHIVVIAGNHELTFDANWDDADRTKYRRMFDYRATPLTATESKKLLTNCTYIEEETIELYGIRIYGSPWQPEFCGWGFNEKRGKPILKKWQKIPSDTDVLMTHGPPLGIGDKCRGGHRAGCSELLTTIQDRVRPRFHIFGHIHEDPGTWTDGTTVYINASICNRSYNYRPLNKPVVFDYEIPDTG